jgi:hypothetical protein
MGADKARAPSDQNTLTIGRSKKLYRWKTKECGIGDGLAIWVVDRFGLICSLILGKFCMLGFLSFCIKVLNSLGIIGRHDIMGAEVQRAEDIDRDLAVETKALEPDSHDFLAALVYGEYLERPLRFG